MDYQNKEYVRELVIDAIGALNRARGLALSFIDAWVFSNSVGGNLHVQFSDANKSFDFSCNVKRIFDTSKITSEDKDSGAKMITAEDKKVLLRIAYALFLFYNNVKNK